LSIIKNPVYKGEYHYGRRSKTLPAPIVGAVPALVSAQAWQAAQDALARNRIIPKNSNRRYMLRSVMKCGLCGLTYTATWSHGELWYRCNGGLMYRGPHRERCASVYLRASRLEPLIWTDVERFLRDPGDLLDELREEQHDTSAAALREAERQIAGQGLAGIQAQRDRVLDFLRRGKMTPDECERQMDAIIAEEAVHHARLVELTPDDTQPDDEPDMDLLDALRHRIVGADEALRQEVVSILVRQITIKTEFVDGRKRGTIVVEYRFPGVVDTGTGTGSARRPA
jgi:site-specific DNA recombinase